MSGAPTADRPVPNPIELTSAQSAEKPVEQRKPISERAGSLLSRFSGWIRGRNPNPDTALQEIAAFPLEATAEKRFKNIREIYISMLGLKEFPANPETMPDTFHMPHAGLGDIGTAITQMVDGVDMRERSQTQYFRNGVIISSGIFAGKADRVNESLKRVVEKSVGMTAFSDYHTHPEDSGWSDDDIAASVGYSSGSLIDMVGSHNQIIALLNTDKSFHHRFPIGGSEWAYFRTLKDLSKIFEEASAPFNNSLGGDTDKLYEQCHKDDMVRKIKYLEEKGYAVYAANINPDSAKSNFPNGVDFKKVTSQLLEASKISI